MCNITWITGNSGAGKTTYANKIKKKGDILLDGDDVRTRINKYNLTKSGRIKHNINVAKWAKLLADQGFNVVVSLICPFEYLRKEVKAITNCEFIYLEFEGDDIIPNKPYEKPINPSKTITTQLR